MGAKPSKLGMQQNRPAGWNHPRQVVTSAEVIRVTLVAKNIELSQF